MCNSLHILSGAGRPQNLLFVPRRQRRERSSCSELQVRYAAPPEQVCEQTWTHSGFLRSAPQGLPQNPMLARRAQVLSERQRVRNRSELRLLAYPRPDCRRRPTTWKKNGRCAAPGRVRAASRNSLRVLLAGARKPCVRRGERSILREAPRASRKMWSESTLP